MGACSPSLVALKLTKWRHRALCSLSEFPISYLRKFMHHFGVSNCYAVTVWISEPLMPCSDGTTRKPSSRFDWLIVQAFGSLCMIMSNLSATVILYSADRMLAWSAKCRQSILWTAKYPLSSTKLSGGGLKGVIFNADQIVSGGQNHLLHQIKM